MVLADLRDRYPVLDGWMVQLQGLLDPRRVVLSPDDQALHLAWWSEDDWQLSSIDLPPDLCRAGQPLNRQALGETIADLLLERGLTTAQVTVELLLPLASCQWRVLTGPAAPELRTAEDLRALQPELTWSLALQESYLDVVPMPERDAAVVVGAERLLLQAWLETLEEADVPVRRAEWVLLSAWRGLLVAHGGVDQRLVWLVEQGGRWRLLLLCDGCPQVDLTLEGSDIPSLQDEVSELVQAWCDRAEAGAAASGSVSVPGWWVTAAAQSRGQWGSVHDPKQGPLRSDAEMSLLGLALMAPLEASR